MKDDAKRNVHTECTLTKQQTYQLRQTNKVNSDVLSLQQILGTAQSVMPNVSDVLLITIM